jgi:hypothetical protein
MFFQGGRLRTAGGSEPSSMAVGITVRGTIKVPYCVRQLGPAESATLAQ